MSKKVTKNIIITYIKTAGLCIAAFVWLTTAPGLASEDEGNAEKLFSQKKYFSALSEYRVISANELGDATGDKAGLRLGDCYFGLCEFEQAQRYYRRFLEQYPKSQNKAYGEFFYGASLFKQGKYDEAQSVFEKFLKRYRRNALYSHAYYAHAICLFYLEKYSISLSRLGVLLNELRAGPDIKEGAQFYVAEAWFKRGSYPEAEREFKKFLKYFPKSEYISLVHYKLGETLSSRGKLKEAQEELEKVLTFDINSEMKAFALYAMGLNACLESKYTTALEYFKRITGEFSSFPISELSRFNIAWCYLKNGDYGQSKDAFFSFIQKHPRSRLVYTSQYLVCLSIYLSHDYAGAITQIEKFLKKYPKGSLATEGVYWLAVSKFKNGAIDEALKKFQRLSQQDSASATIREKSDLMMADCYLKLKEYDTARKFYNIFLDRYPETSLIDSALYGIGLSFAGRGDYGMARDVFNKLVTKFPDSGLISDVMVEIGNTFIEQGDYDRAIEKFIKILKKCDDVATVNKINFKLGFSYYKNGSYEKAVEKFSVLKGKKISNVDEVLYYLALGHLKLKEYDRSLKAFRELLSRAPSSNLAPESLLRTADIVARQGDGTQAKKTYLAVADQYPDSPAAPFALYTLASMYRREGDEKQSVLVFSRLVEKYSLSNFTADIIYQIAEYMFNQKSYALAQTAYQRILDNYPGSKFALDAEIKVGDTYLALGNFNSAIKHFQEVVANRPDSDTGAIAQYKIGTYYESIEKTRLAVENYQRVVEDFAATAYAPKAQENIIAIWKAMKEDDLAAQATEFLFSKFPRSEAAARILLAQGKDCQNKGDAEGAVRYYRQTTELSQGEISAEAQKLIGDYYFDKKMYKESTVEYLKTVYLFRNHPKFAAEAQKR